MQKKVEDLVADKILELVNYLLSKKIKPDIKMKDVTELNIDVIRDIKEKYNIEGVILDVDSTLRKRMKDIPKCNKEWLDMIKQELKVIAVSNGKDNKIEEELNSRGIEYIGFACKPLKKNFLKACEKMQLNPEQVLVIGDQLLYDIYGGNRNDMKTVQVRDVKGYEEK